MEETLSTSGEPKESLTLVQKQEMNVARMKLAKIQMDETNWNIEQIPWRSEKIE